MDLKVEFTKFVINADRVKFDDLTNLVLAEAQSLTPEKPRTEDIYVLPPDEN